MAARSRAPPCLDRPTGRACARRTRGHYRLECYAVCRGPSQGGQALRSLGTLGSLFSRMSREPLSYGSRRWSRSGMAARRTTGRGRSPLPSDHALHRSLVAQIGTGRRVAASGFVSGSISLLHCKSDKRVCGWQASLPVAVGHEADDSRSEPASPPAPSHASAMLFADHPSTCSGVTPARTRSHRRPSAPTQRRPAENAARLRGDERASPLFSKRNL